MHIKGIATASVLGVLAFGGGVAYAATPGTDYAPAPHRSWVAQEHAEVKCAPVMDDVSWEDCLVRDYYKSTKKRLSAAEYVTNGAKGTWKVSWSHVVLPKGGDRLSAKDKVVDGLPKDPTVYCKVYSSNETDVILCNNGIRIGESNLGW
jgi:hypothetical protein